MSVNQAAKPDLRSISRREFLTLTSAAAAVLVATGPSGAASSPLQAAAGTPFQLPKVPSQNPAFMAAVTSDQGLAVWAQKPDRELVAYHLNAPGRVVWRLCDGIRQPAQIAAEFAETTGRPAAEGTAFLDRLLELSVIVSGAYVVPGEGFPRPPEGGAYRLQIQPGEGETP